MPKVESEARMEITFIASKERSSAVGVLQPRLQWQILPVPGFELDQVETSKRLELCMYVCQYVCMYVCIFLLEVSSLPVWHVQG